MIFPFVWHLLPGPLVVRIILLVITLSAIVWLCFAEVFPWLADNVLPQPDAAVGNGNQ